MTSFQAKIDWKRQRKRKNKIYPFVSFLLDPNIKFQKCGKKIQKIKNSSMASFKARIGWKRPGKKEIKYCRSVSFLPNA